MTTADDPRPTGGIVAGDNLPIDAERRYQLLVDNIQDHAIYLLDADGKVASWNSGAERLKGYKAAEIVGRDFSCFYTAEARAIGRPQEALRRATENGVFTEEAERVAKDGHRFWAQVSLRAIRDSRGMLVGFSKITQDITERRSIEAQRRMASAILDYSPDSIIVLNRQGKIERVNDRALAMFGHPRNVLVGGHIEMLLPERYRDRHVAHRDGFFARPAIREMGSGLDLHARRADGSEFPVDVVLGPLELDTDGFVIAIVRDITERRSLEAPSRMAAAILDYSPDSILLLSQGGRIERVNDSALALFGHPRENLIGRPIELLLPERFRDRHVGYRDGFFAKPTRRAMGSGLNLQAQRADGTEFPVDVMLGPIALDTGNFVIAIVRDITERKATAEALANSQREQAIAEERVRAGDALRRTSETLEKIVQASPVAIIAIDDDDRVTIWNATAERLFEAAAVDVLGRRRSELWADLRPKGVTDPAALRSSVIRDHAVRNLAGSLRQSDGTLLELSVSIVSLGGGSSARTDGFLFLVDDVTQQKATEEHLRQAQKMEAVGQLTGGIAHDFNNLLAIIYGNLELILERVDSKQLRDLTGDALSAAERGASLTHRLLAYSRQQQLAPTLVDIDKLVHELVVVLRRTIEESVHIETNVAPDLWPARIDAHQLENSLINLVVNARDAMPQGGRLTITAENAMLDEHYAAEVVDLAPGEYVMVSVSDTGIGMPKHVAQRALEPFFTTKPVGRGTGLGLSMVYGFIKQSGGHLKIYSEPGHGTSVKLFLPRAEVEGAIARPIATREPIPVGAGDRLVLVIEDESAVRRLQIQFLESLGYHTLEAEDGVIGLAMLEANPRIDLILTDVVLPNGVSGLDVATTALKRRPTTKIIFMSGYSRHAMTMPRELRSIPILSKPFARAQLAEMVAKVFGRS